LESPCHRGSPSHGEIPDYRYDTIGFHRLGTSERVRRAFDRTPGRAGSRRVCALGDLVLNCVEVRYFV
jgi:hypothetical protein